MKLWTYHPAAFRVDGHKPIDPTRGSYWNDPSLCYREALPRLCRLLGIDYFPLWCFTAPDSWLRGEGPDWPMEWVLTVPDEEVTALIRSSAWDRILKGQSQEWHQVRFTDRPEKLGNDVTAIVRFPLAPHWSCKLAGQVLPHDYRSELDRPKRLPSNRLTVELQKLRDVAADPQLSKYERIVLVRRLTFLDQHFSTPLRR